MLTQAGSLDEWIQGAFARTDAWQDEIHRALHADLVTVLPFDMLEKVDRASMWNSLEVRSPFLDRRMSPVAFAFAGQQHVGLRRTKKVLRELAVRLLPAEIASGPKRGFEIPLAEWFRGPLRSLVRERLDPVNLKSVDLIDADRVEALVEEHESRSFDRSWEIWNLMVLQAWADNSRML